jgi:hypothetical protein
MNNPIARREFLSAAALGLTIPNLLAQTETAPLHHGMTIGHGTFQYRVDKLWSKADREKTPVKDCHEMVQSADGRLFLITNLKQNNVIVFNTEGQVLDAWSVGFTGGHGLTIHKEGGTEFLYLSDTGGRIVKTTLDGKPVLELPHPA